MGVLGTYGPNALKYYGSILASAYQNLSTSDMWTAIRTTQATYGLPKPGASAPDVSVIRGYANRIVAGASAFAGADESDTITSDMMAVAPYTSRDLNAISTNPIYHVRFLNTVQADDGSVTSVWQTSVFTATDFPDTVGELQDAIDTNASELAAQGIDTSTTTPRGTSVSTSNIEITLVLSHGRISSLPSVERFELDPARYYQPRHRDTRHTGIPGSARAAMLACPR